MWPNLWRVVNLIHILLILAHWFGCFYFLLSEAEGFQVIAFAICHVSLGPNLIWPSAEWRGEIKKMPQVMNINLYELSYAGGHKSRPGWDRGVISRANIYTRLLSLFRVIGCIPSVQVITQL